jgi:5-methyltetrahydropteroyltriglutamate--homocysteine methyltransferase
MIVMIDTLRFTFLLLTENVIAGTDCGIGGRVNPQFTSAKLHALRDRAAIASKKLWS